MKRTALKRKTPLKRGPWRRKKVRLERGFKRITRKRFLTPKEAAEDERVRRLVEKEFPPLRKRQPTALQRRAWMPRQSEKRKLETEIYRIQAPRFLTEHPWCQMNVTCGARIIKRNIPGVEQIDAPRRATQVHHAKGRGPYYLDESTWIGCCARCHYWENSNRNEAVKLGLRERVYQKH